MRAAAPSDAEAPEAVDGRAGANRIGAVFCFLGGGCCAAEEAEEAEAEAEAAARAAKVARSELPSKFLHSYAFATHNMCESE